MEATMSAPKQSVLLVCAWLAVSAADWPQWRGPSADGISLERDLPVQWDGEHNIAWKARLPGLGTSTPIVWGDRIFLTSQIGDGPIGEGPIAGPARDLPGSPPARRGARQKQVRFAVEAFERIDGKVAWQYVFDAEGELPPVHTMHNLATPSCVTDGHLVYAWFGTGQLVALSLNGKLVWKRNIGKEYSHFFVLWGHGSSPLLYKDRLILLCDHRDASYLLALDKTTGAQLWKVDRGKERRSYSTPVVIPGLGDRGDQILVNGKERIDVYDFATGDLRWYVGQAVTLALACPVLHDGILYVTRGDTSGPYSAVETGGFGDASSRVKWEVKTGAPYIASPLYYQGVLYLAGETGVVTAVDAVEGKTLWKARIGGIFSASPVEADGKVYLLNEDRTELGAQNRFLPFVAWRQGKLQHLPDRLARQPKLSRRLPDAHPVHLYRSPYACIHFHLVHLPVSHKHNCPVMFWN
jgi:outer membrane protein assembly factor BamB